MPPEATRPEYPAARPSGNPRRVDRWAAGSLGSPGLPPGDPVSFQDEHFRQSLVYSARTSAGTLLGHLRHIREGDAKADAEYKRRSTRATRTMFGGWGAAVLLCFTGVEALIIAGVCLAVLTALVAFAFFSGAQKYQRLVLEERRHQLLTRVLELLRADMHPSEPVHVSLDLRSAQHDSKRTAKGKRDLWTLEHFVDPWLSLETRLLDGTHLHLTVVDKVRRRSGLKHTGRKVKHKSKTKRATHAVLRLRVRPERFPGLSAQARTARQAVQLPQGVRLARVAVGADRLLLKVDLGQDWEAGKASPLTVDGSRVVGMMLMSLYQVLNLSRTQARVGQAQS